MLCSYPCVSLFGLLVTALASPVLSKLVFLKMGFWKVVGLAFCPTGSVAFCACFRGCSLKRKENYLLDLQGDRCVTKVRQLQCP